MENKRFHKAIHEIKTIRMSATEKQRMLEQIMKLPVIAAPKKAAIKSPWTIYSFNIWIGQHRAVAGALIVVLIVALSGGTIASAAENTVPGDALYSLKVKVTEPLRDVLAATPQARAEWQVEKSDRRMQEAETLAAAGKLDATKEAEINTLLQEHTAELTSSLEAVRRNQSIERADDITIAFQAGMNAHAKVLETIASEPTAATEANLKVSAGIVEVARANATAVDIKSRREVAVNGNVLATSRGSRVQSRAKNAEITTKQSAPANDSIVAPTRLAPLARGMLPVESQCISEQCESSASSLSRGGNTPTAMTVPTVPPPAVSTPVSSVPSVGVSVSPSVIVDTNPTATATISAAQTIGSESYTEIVDVKADLITSMPESDPASKKAPLIKNASTSTDPATSTSNKIKKSDQRVSKNAQAARLYDKRARAVRALIDATQTSLDRLKDTDSSLQKSVIANTKQILEQAENSYIDAQAAVKTDSSDDAYDALRNSERSAREASVFLKAGLKFNSDRSKESK